MADIADVYAWMAADGSKVNLVMTLAPSASVPHAFGPGIQYVFHVTSKPGGARDVVGAPGGSTTNVICTFASATSAECWVVGPTGAVKDYLAGDPSNPAGTTNGSGKVRLFAGPRSDPAYFNLQGFRTAVAALGAKVQATDEASCPMLDYQNAGTLRTLLTTAPSTSSPPCPAYQLDCFAGRNVMALVLQVEKSLLNAHGNAFLAVWGSTHREGS